MSQLTEKKLESKCNRVINMSTSSTRPPSCMYCFGELSPIDGTPANMLFPSERDSASSRSRPPPRARFLPGMEREVLGKISSVHTDKLKFETLQSKTSLYDIANVSSSPIFCSTA